MKGNEGSRGCAQLQTRLPSNRLQINQTNTAPLAEGGRERACRERGGLLFSGIKTHRSSIILTFCSRLFQTFSSIFFLVALAVVSKLVKPLSHDRKGLLEAPVFAALVALWCSLLTDPGSDYMLLDRNHPLVFDLCADFVRDLVVLLDRSGAGEHVGGLKWSGDRRRKHESSYRSETVFFLPLWQRPDRWPGLHWFSTGKTFCSFRGSCWGPCSLQ